MNDGVPQAWLDALPRQEGFARLVADLRLIEGFSVFLAMCPTAPVADAMWRALQREVDAARGARGTWGRIEPYSFPRGTEGPAEWLVQRVLFPLAEDTPVRSKELRVIAVDATRCPPADDGAWEQLFSRMNRARNTIALRQRCPIVFLLPPRLEERFVAAAPDFWTGRTAAVQIEAPQASLSPEAITLLAEATELLPADMLDLVPRDPRTVNLQGLDAQVPLRVDGLLLAVALAEVARTQDVRRLAVIVDRLLASDDRLERVALARALDGFADSPEVAACPPLRQAATEQSARVWEAIVQRTKGPSDELLHDLSAALHRVGDLRRERGEFASALAAYESALALRRRVVARRPGDAFWRQRLLRSLRRKGDLLWRVGDLGGATSLFNEAVALSRALVEEAPKAGDRLLDLAVDLLRATVASLGRRDLRTGRQCAEEAHAAAKRLEALDAQRVEWRHALALTQIALAVVGEGTARGPDAERAWRSAELALRMLTQERPGDRALVAAHALCARRLYGREGADVTGRFVVGAPKGVGG